MRDSSCQYRKGRIINSLTILRRYPEHNFALFINNVTSLDKVLNREEHDKRCNILVVLREKRSQTYYSGTYRR